jgi:hypothetical protein
VPHRESREEKSCRTTGALQQKLARVAGSLNRNATPIPRAESEEFSARRDYRRTQNPCASIPSAVLNLLRKIDGGRSDAHIGGATVQIAAKRGTIRNLSAT